MSGRSSSGLVPFPSPCKCCETAVAYRGDKIIRCPVCNGFWELSWPTDESIPPSVDGNDPPEDQLAYLAEEEMTPAEKIKAFPLRKEGVEDRDILVKEENRGKFTLALMDAMVSLRSALVSLDHVPQDGSRVVDSVNHCRWAICRELWYLLKQHHTCDNIGGSPIPDDLMRYIAQD